ncbi:NYN domain-containing protein [Oryzomonas sagensis]|uniref:NYN domain-containing protein n=1 Tax=Oryzomonas sagensis TaxID=2603857 RepID=A0ABQ6TLU9_9BACT|nr:NYN domain-containing protein [Oryzomonas sagensis]KAB0669033.1 NYN domain-containing protein [Oryzomonas sagensis]
MVRTYVYIDGFNLYHRLLYNSPYKWLDVKRLCEQLLKPYNQIVAIKYFTALVSGRTDPNQPIRQETYFRAMQHYIPEMTLYYGSFQTHPKIARLVTPINGKNYAEVLKTEEKGSDVNLSVHLLNDAWLDAYDSAVLISNDSDIAEALRLVRLHHPTKTIGLLSPVEMPSNELKKHATYVKKIRNGVLANSQLPNPVPGTSFSKPASW